MAFTYKKQVFYPPFKIWALWSSVDRYFTSRRFRLQGCNTPANQLVGSNIDEAVIEMNFTGISFDVVRRYGYGSVVGAEMRIDINGRQYAGGRSHKTR